MKNLLTNSKDKSNMQTDENESGIQTDEGESEIQVNDEIEQRVKTSRLLGQDPSLVLHGGGNTSLKVRCKNIFGQYEDILYIKGSGWDLATIKKAGFSPAKLDYLKKLVKLEHLDDVSMVREQRLALIDPFAPNPSVEAILHAIIPFKFVDHTHADAVVTLTNNPNGLKHIQNVYGNDLLVIPYVMPGFVLAKAVYKATCSKEFKWEKCKGIILMNHGIFTFANTAQESYDNMINLVAKATNYLIKFQPVSFNKIPVSDIDLIALANLRKAVSNIKKEPVLMRLDNSEHMLGFSMLDDMKQISTRGPLTPDHVIRTKLKPLIINRYDSITKSVDDYANDYKNYFDKYTDGKLICLDKAPKWGIWQGKGAIIFGKNPKEIEIINDIKNHTTRAILQAEAFESWQPLPEKDIFEVEYWDLEQNKLKNQKKITPFGGRVALVTGAANGIGKATVEALIREGTAVIALDIDVKVETCYKSQLVKGICCDITKIKKEQNQNKGYLSVNEAIEKAILHFGGIDMLVSNAGVFTKSETIENIDSENWQNSLNINLTATQNIIQALIPYLKVAINPSIVIVGSKNVQAPGYGASAYSVAKTGLVQLARIAALELSEHKINVNVVHPDAVYDTNIWTKNVLEARAKYYKLSVKAYKSRNLLKTEILSKDVAEVILSLLSPVFSKTTGAQIPIDGGNDRVI